MRIVALTGQLRPTPPFDFQQSLRFLSLFAPTQREQQIASATLRKAISIDGQPLILEVGSDGDIEQPVLSYRLWSAQSLSAATQQAALDRISFYLSLPDDLCPFYATGRSDPAFAPVIERLYGYHQVKFLTPFENACWAVLTQRTPTPTARAHKQALIERYGGALELEGQSWRAFPEPAALAAAQPDDLAALLRNERKAGYLHALACAFEHVDERWLRVAPYDEVERWLRGISGIGPWSAAFVLVRGLGRMERLPVEERLIEAASSVYRLDPATATRAAVEQIAQPYGVYRGYWAHYLRVAG